MATSVTANQIAKLRRMVDEPTSTTFTDEELISVIEEHAVIDELGVDPYKLVYSSSIPTRVTNDGWIPTFDLNAAAADIWEQKAATLVMKHDFSADGGSYSQSQQYQQALSMINHYQSRKSARSIKVVTNS